MANFGDERAPLEFTKPSNRQKVAVCPKCKNGISVSINCVGLICSNCKCYYSYKDSLSESEMVSMINNTPIISKEFIKQKGASEIRANEFRKKQIKLKKEGKVRSHEPGGVPRKW